MRYFLPHIIFLILLASPTTASSAQEPTDSLHVFHGRGLEIFLSNSGFGAGAFIARNLGQDWSLRLGVDLGAVKDEREVAFFDRFGHRDVPNKANYLLEMPLQVGLERRVFRSKIEDNFRPFLSFSAGPLVGWLYPYFDDDNENGLLDEGEKTHDVLSGLPRGHFRTGVSLSFSVGARFGDINDSSYGVRFGYRASIYNEEIALLEASIKAPSRRFGTPLIVVYFGALGN